MSSSSNARFVDACVACGPCPGSAFFLEGGIVDTTKLSSSAWSSAVRSVRPLLRPGFGFKLGVGIEGGFSDPRMSL